MDKRFRAIVIVAVLVIVAILGLAGYFSWMNITRVDTLKAQVEGQLVEVRGPAMARVEELPLELGDAVMEGEEVALLKVIGTEGALMVPLLAPVSGVVANKVVQVGDTLAAGAPLLTLVDPDQVWISAAIHQNRVPQVRVGQQVRVRVFTRTRRWIFWGRVEQVGIAAQSALTGAGAGAASTTTSTDVPVIISVDSAGYPLFPGMRAEVRIRLEPRSSLW